MAATPDIKAPAASVTVVGSFDTAGLQAFTGHAVVVYNIPTKAEHAAGLTVMAVMHRNAQIEAVAMSVTAVVTGRTNSPFACAWPFVLDGHEYYVLNLPTQLTLVLDLATDKWYVWGCGCTDQWRARIGQNWDQLNPISYNYGSNIVVGDDTTGALYILDPEHPVDDSGVAGVPAAPFQRITYGQIPLRGFDSHPCYGVLLSGSTGYVDDPSYVKVNLKTSDDQGNSWWDQGDNIVDQGAYNQRLYWGSCGSMVAPGRLFKLTDFGGIHRIDGLDMDDPDDDSNPATS